LEKKKDGKGKSSMKTAVSGVEDMDEDEVEDEEDNDDTIEQRYATKTASTPNADASTAAVDANSEDEDMSDKAPSGDEDEDEAADMTVDVDAGKADKKKGRVKKMKYVPEGESSVDRDRRTVFVGNVAVEVLKSKVSCIHLSSREPFAWLED
jgi:nucleolar protein 12